jgi:glycosyltransferase involved in cell wall biosynthesis
MIVENLPVPFDRRVWLEACALRDAGYEVTVICPQMRDFTRPYEVLEGITVHRHPLPIEGSGAVGFILEYMIAWLFELVLAWKVFLTRGFGILHACNPPDNIFLIALTFRLFGVKFVFDQHDINPELWIAKYGRRDVFYWLLLAFERMTYATAHLVISTNQSYRAIAMGRGKKHPDSVHVVRSAPNCSRFRPVDPDPALREGFDHLLAYVGVMGKQEGIDLLIEAMEVLVRTRGKRNVKLLLAGSGPERPALEAMVSQKGLGDQIQFLGRIPDEQLLALLSTADVCVNPDRVNEMNDKSTMNKIMEYMAVGKPIVQFEMTEGRVSAGEASLYARPNDPVDLAAKFAELLDNPARREAMGQIGRERMETVLDWKYSREALIRAYETLQPRTAD